MMDEAVNLCSKDYPCEIKLEYSGYFWKISRNMTENILRNF